jgi:predicted acetyltransferase
LHIEFTRALLAEKGTADFTMGLPILRNTGITPIVSHSLYVDGELAGFVLVIKGTAVEPIQIGEFFVMEKFGGKGVGKTVARRVFDMFPGNWLIHEMWNNYKAQAFWRSVVNSYTNGNYQEYYDEHRRPFQKFSTQGL